MAHLQFRLSPCSKMLSVKPKHWRGSLGQFQHPLHPVGQVVSPHPTPPPPTSCSSCGPKAWGRMVFMPGYLIPQCLLNLPPHVHYHRPWIIVCIQLFSTLLLWPAGWLSLSIFLTPVLSWTCFLFNSKQLSPPPQFFLLRPFLSRNFGKKVFLSKWEFWKDKDLPPSVWKLL